MRQKYYKQKQIGNADSVNNLMRQWKTSYQHAQYWQNNNIYIYIRHNRVCAQLQFNICKETAVKLDDKHWYDHVPQSVETSHEGKVTILWIQQVQTDRTIPNNKPDIIFRDNKKGTRMLIDVAIPGDRNLIKKEAAKIL